MIDVIIMIVMFVMIVVLIVYVIQKRDQVKYLNKLIDRQAQQLLDERRSMSIERQIFKSDLYQAKRSYKRAEDKFKI